MALVWSVSGTPYFYPESDDMKFYNDWALRIADGQWTDGKAFYGLPGYAYSLAGIYSITGGYDSDSSPLLVALLQALFHGLTAGFLFSIARSLFPEMKWLPVLCAGAWVLLTPAQVFTAILMPTSWVICAFWGTVCLLVRNYKKGRGIGWKAALALGIGMGLVGTTVATIFILLPLVFVAIPWFAARRWVAGGFCILGALAIWSVFGMVFEFQWYQTAILGVVILLIALFRRKNEVVFAVIGTCLLGGVYLGTLPVWAHNRFVAGEKVFLSAHSGINFYLGNHPESNGYTSIPSGMRTNQAGLLRDSEMIPQKELGRRMTRAEISAYWSEKAAQNKRENPSAWMRVMGRKFDNFWNLYQYDDLSILKLLRDEGAIPPGLKFGFIAALGLAGLPFCLRFIPASRWVGAAVALHLYSLMLVFITERYRLAAAPGLILLGAGGLAVFWDSLVKAKWMCAAAYVSLLVGAGWYCSIPRGIEAGWGLDFYKAGIRATAAAATMKGPERDAALARAERNLRTANAYVPKNAETTMALGRLAFERGELEKAERCFAETVRLAAERGIEHESALTNLGMLAMQRKDWAAAEIFLERAAAVDPRYPKVWFNLAETRGNLGKIPAALDAAAKALELRPGQPDVVKLEAELRARLPK